MSPTKGWNANGNISHYDPARSTNYTTGLWATCPLLAYQFDRSIGTLFEENWEYYDATNRYTLTQSTTGTAAMDTVETDTLLLDSNSATVVQGAQIQRVASSYFFVADTELWAEFEFKVEDTATSCEFFVGFSETDTAILDTSAMASEDCLAFWCVTDDGVMLYGGEKNTAGDTTTSATLVDGTYVKVGFYVNGVTSAEGFYNGTSVGTAHGTANIPTVAMRPSFVCQSSGTTDPIMHLRGYRIFQTRA